MITTVRIPANGRLYAMEHINLEGDAGDAAVLIWRRAHGKWCVLADDYEHIPNAESLVILKQETAPYCPNFIRHLYTLEVTSYRTKGERETAARKAKAVWREACGRECDQDHVWVLLYCDVSDVWLLKNEDADIPDIGQRASTQVPPTHGCSPLDDVGIGPRSEADNPGGQSQGSIECPS